MILMLEKIELLICAVWMKGTYFSHIFMYNNSILLMLDERCICISHISMDNNYILMLEKRVNR